jgi:transcriptional regulator with XRE-family HTH domain
MIKQKYTEIAEYVRLAIVLYGTKQARGFQKKIADALDIKKTYVSDFFNGKRMISEDLRADVAKYLGFKYEDLITLGKKISNKSANIGGESRTGAYNEDFPKNVMEEKNITVSELSFLLDISEAEYIFKEQNLIAFTNKELKKLADYAMLTPKERAEYLKNIWRYEKDEHPPDNYNKEDNDEAGLLSNIQITEEKAVRRMMAEYKKVMEGMDGFFKDLGEE